MIESAMKNPRLVIPILALLAVLVSACASTPRPTPPVAGAPLVQPWGSVRLQAADGTIDPSITDNFIRSLQAKRDEMRQAGGTDKILYRALTLSGGGSRGAYGAGVLSGWTVRGDRPQFDVVTGISTGACWPRTRFSGRSSMTVLRSIKTQVTTTCFGSAAHWQ